MDFKEAYDHFLEGTATDSETEFVRTEIKKAHEIDAVLGSAPFGEIFNEPEKETIKKARKKFNLKTTIRIVVVVLCILILLAAAICGYIFGTAIPAAKRSSKLSRAQALECAQDYLTSFLGKDASSFIVHDIDRHLYTEHHLRDTVYVYQVELRDGFVEYELTVNAASGFVALTDIDHHD